MRERIDLPASKSISNRVLIIRALSGCDFQINNLSNCDDTNVMLAGLKNMPETIDVGAAGTSMRFLTAYLAQLDGQEHVITGSARMKQRPIKVLVNALRSLGADIEYLEEVGFPPLKIRGKKLKCQSALEMDGSVSSQYISAMLMIGPMLESGLTLRLNGEVASRPYIDMTLALMRHFGAKAKWVDYVPVIDVEPVPYHFSLDSFTVEPDWSAAAFWLEIMALRNNQDEDRLILPGLSENSLQGDSVVRNLFFGCGCFLNMADHTLVSESKIKDIGNLVTNFSKCPDLAQAMVVACCMNDIPFVFSGLESLHIKETDRIAALKNELAKLGYVLHGGDGAEEGTLIWQRGSCKKTKQPVIETYKDHRMAMAFAPCCIKTGEICIAEPEVVTKSYPSFWDDLKKVGFSIEEVVE